MGYTPQQVIYRKTAMATDMNIKVMYLNPVSNSSDDQVFADLVAEYKYPATAAAVASLDPRNVPPEMNHLEYRAYESLIISDTVKAARQASKDGYDALVIGCFYDPALHDAREISGETIVVAPCQASIITALNLANNFSILVGRAKWEDQMRQTVYDYGYRDQLASFETVDLGVQDFHRDAAATEQKLQQAALQAVTGHHAESIILGCTMEIGFYRRLQQFLRDELGTHIPVIDPAIASFKAAENAALQKQFGWTNSRIWGMQAPPEEELKQFNIFQQDYEFGNVIRIPPTT